MLGSGIVLSTGNGGSPRSCLATDSWSVKKVGIVKVLKLFSYLQNYQSYGSGSVKQWPKIDILFPIGNGSSPILTKLCVNIPHEASTNPWNFGPCGSNQYERTQESVKVHPTRFFTPSKLFSSTSYTRSSTVPFPFPCVKRYKNSSLLSPNPQFALGLWRGKLSK